jgi:hypothetical protein
MGCLTYNPLWASALIGSLLFGCSSLPRDPVPPAYADKVAILDGTQVRYWGDRSPPNMNALAAEKWAQVKATRPYLLKQGTRHKLAFLPFPAAGPTAHSGPAYWWVGLREAIVPNSISSPESVPAL